jgi:hypothetical protein
LQIRVHRFDSGTRLQQTIYSFFLYIVDPYAPFGNNAEKKIGNKVMASTSKYPVTRLAQITSKGGYYYVQVTKPADVFKVTGGNRTVRKSTGSRDRKQAESAGCSTNPLPPKL